MAGHLNIELLHINASKHRLLPPRLLIRRDALRIPLIGWAKHCETPGHGAAGCCGARPAAHPLPHDDASSGRVLRLGLPRRIVPRQRGKDGTLNAVAVAVSASIARGGCVHAAAAHHDGRAALTLTSGRAVGRGRLPRSAARRQRNKHAARGALSPLGKVLRAVPPIKRIVILVVLVRLADHQQLLEGECGRIISKAALRQVSIGNAAGAKALILSCGLFPPLLRIAAPTPLRHLRAGHSSRAPTARQRRSIRVRKNFPLRRRGQKAPRLRDVETEEAVRPAPRGLTTRRRLDDPLERSAVVDCVQIC